MSGIETLQLMIIINQKTVQYVENEPIIHATNLDDDSESSDFILCAPCNSDQL